MVGIGNDISKRIMAQNAVQESEEFYRQLVKNTNEAVMVTQDGLLNFFNNRAMELTGCSQEELDGKPFADLIHPDDRDTVADCRQKLETGDNTPLRCHLRLIGKDGQESWEEDRSFSSQ